MAMRYATSANLLAELMKLKEKTPQQLLAELIEKLRIEGKIGGRKSGVTDFANLIGKTSGEVYEMLKTPKPGKPTRLGKRRQQQLEEQFSLPKGHFSDGGGLTERIRAYRAAVWTEFSSGRVHDAVARAPEVLAFLKKTYDEMPLRGPPWPTVELLESMSGVLLGKVRTLDELERTIALNQKASEPSEQVLVSVERRTSRRKKTS
jgi:hypothetical protein